MTDIYDDNDALRHAGALPLNKRSDQKFGVWCEVYGGVTGRREAWLKSDNGERAAYVTRDEAEQEAERLNARSAVSSTGAIFNYTVKELS